MSWSSFSLLDMAWDPHRRTILRPMGFRFMSHLLPSWITALAVAPAMIAAQPASERTPEQILIRAKTTYHAHAVPRYVVYTVQRKERTNGVIDFADSYKLRLWCRTSDNRCLARHVTNGRVGGPLVSLQPRFNAAIDPGPVTVDLFEPPPPPRATPPPATSTLPTIGSVRAQAEADFRARSARRIGDAYELEVEPRRDPDRNRAQTMTIDAQTFELRRVIARDRLYLAGSATSYPETFTIDLRMLAGHPILDHIHGGTGEGYDSEVDYTYSNVTFPETLPAWYFEPASYGIHFAEAPDS